MKVTGMILAGGKSSRMGTNKALLQIDGEKNIERLKKMMLPLVDHVILVTNEPETYAFLELNIVQDLIKDRGPLAGIQSGLQHSSDAWNLAVACDLPFFNGEMAGFLVARAKEQTSIQAIVPVIKGREHPLFAMYHHSILPVVDNSLKKNKRRIRDVLTNVNVEYLTEKDFTKAGFMEAEVKKAFFNMNRPEDYQWAISNKTK